MLFQEMATVEMKIDFEEIELTAEDVQTYFYLCFLGKVFSKFSNRHMINFIVITTNEEQFRHSGSFRKVECAHSPLSSSYENNSQFCYLKIRTI